MEVPTDASSRSQPKPVRQPELPSNDDTMEHGDDRLDIGKLNAMQLKDLMDFVLQFLSTCSNETLLLVLACLAGATYIILGRLGLLLIGAALGVTLHASWESAQDGYPTGSQSFNRKHVSLNIVHKLLDWESGQRVKNSQDSIGAGETFIEGSSSTNLGTSSFGPVTATAVQSLIDAAVRDYVNYWYEPILSESTFPNSCRTLLTGFITSVSSHLSRKRTTDTLLEFLTNSSSMVIVFLNELSTAFEAAGPGVTAEDAIVQYLESNPESSLSSLLAHQQQRKKLATIADDLLSRFLDPAAYSCIALRNFFREVLVGIVFETTISSMSKPEFINGWITYLFSEGESEIMSAIDAGVEGARNHGVTAAKISGELMGPPSMSTDGSIVGTGCSPPKFSGQAPDQVDQATEKAMLEAKRLSEMIAAQSSPKDAKQTIQPIQNDGCIEGADNGNSAIADADVEGPTKELPKIEGLLAGAGSAAEVQSAEVAGSRKPSGSLLSPSLQSSVVPSTSSPAENIEPLPAITLHRASITVDDSFDSGDKTTLRSKPTSNYLIQIEPHSGRSSGWMVFKRYTDLESIHETLGTISRLNQLRFGDSHSLVPPWKGRTRQALARDLERYLQDALQLEPLAESVTMRRFLEREGGLGSEAVDSLTKPGFVFPGQAAFENVGKGVLGVLSSAPKGVSGGGKAVLEGVSGVFGGGVNRKLPTAPSSNSGNKKDGGTIQRNESVPKGNDSKEKVGRNPRLSSDVIDSALSSQPPKPGDVAGFASPDASFTESSNTLVPSPGSEDDAIDEMVGRVSFDSALLNTNNMTASLVGQQEETESKDAALVENRKSTDTSAGRKGPGSTISADETRMAVELIFAVINELYSLSSAWNIRRTLLNAAKSYILRPGNPSLETIRVLLQESMIDSHTTDEAIGMYIAKLRENALPTAEELSSWPPAMSDDEKERQREVARRVLVQKGLPQAITSVMGAVASREALGKVFDSLQVEVVARGFVFSILLQALRAIVL
ncbi:hypothetical protein BDV12DRAFT_208069 [Aspergillus spectabilis]